MDYLRELPKTDLLTLLEIASEARSASTVGQYQDCFRNMEMLVQFDAALSIYADKVAVDNHKTPTYFFTFVGRAIENDQRKAAILRYITPHFAESLRGLFHADLICRQATEETRLTDRELEILKWLIGNIKDPGNS